MEDFRVLLNIPETYRMFDIDRRVFFPILEELRPYFKNLKIEKIKQGKSIAKLKFTWTKNYKVSQEVIDINLSKELQDTFNYVCSNSFIKEVLTQENKMKLVDLYEEQDLIRGLKAAKKQITISFQKLSYLQNAIEKALEKPMINLTIMDTIIPEKEKNIEIEKQMITLEEYEELYQKYLKNNNVKHSHITRKSWEISVKSKYVISEQSSLFSNENETISIELIPLENLVSKNGSVLKGGALNNASRLNPHQTW
jgi:hypothetical protein